MNTDTKMESAIIEGRKRTTVHYYASYAELTEIRKIQSHIRVMSKRGYFMFRRIYLR